MKGNTNAVHKRAAAVDGDVGEPAKEGLESRRRGGSMCLKGCVPDVSACRGHRESVHLGDAGHPAFDPYRGFKGKEIDTTFD